MGRRKPATTVLGRSASLLAMATKVASRELGNRIFGAEGVKQIETRIAQAQIIADHLANLKGAAMKAGQLLSLDTSDFLPPEAIEILSKLQAQVTETAIDDVERVLLKELGPEKTGRLQKISPNPKAAASIGQLHEATLDGNHVAIKIQYPGVADSIDSDLLILRKLAEGFVSVSGKRFSLEETFSELSRVLKRECDYEIERVSLEKYQALLASDPHYVVPRTYPDFSTKRVLTMSYEHGLHLNDWLRTNPSMSDREAVAHLVLDLFCREFSEWGFVQTDPNFANFLIRTRPLQLVCLDFGATLTYEEDFRRGYAKLLLALGTNDAETIFSNAVSFGLLDPRESSQARDAFKTMIQVSMEPFAADKQPFRFSDPSFEKRSIEANLAFTRALVYSPPPRKILFLHRKLGGIFNLVKKMGVTLNLRPYWDKMTAKAAP